MMYILPYQNQQNSHDMILLHNLYYVIKHYNNKSFIFPISLFGMTK